LLGRYPNYCIFNVRDTGSSKKGKVPTLKIKFGGKKGRKSAPTRGGSSDEEEEEEDLDSDAEFEEMLKVSFIAVVEIC